MQANRLTPQARSAGLVVVVIAVLIVAGLGAIYLAPHAGPLPCTSCASTSSSSTSTNATSSSSTLLIPESTTFLVSSSFDCVAGHFDLNFTATLNSTLVGAINATSPGVTAYISTAEQALNVTDGHPSMWVYDSGLSNSTSLDVAVTPGAYALWIEGDDMGCGATVVEPLEMLTTVIVTENISLEPS